MMSISPISPLSSAALASRLGALGGTSTVASPGGVTPTAKGFGDLVANALDTVNTQQNTADALAQQAATGQLQDPHDYMIAATEASLSTELTVAVRNRAVEAFNDIMRMSI